MSHPFSNRHLEGRKWLGRHGDRASSADGRPGLRRRGFDRECGSIGRQREVSSTAGSTSCGLLLTLGALAGVFWLLVTVAMPALVSFFF